MKKRYLALAAAIGLGILAGCAPAGGPVHTHTYGSWTVTVRPTCVAEGERSRSCTAGDDVQTEKIPATGKHTYDENNVCTVCKHALEYTEGLSYTESAEGYLLTGRGTAEGNEIVVPWYLGKKPVTGIADHAFYEERELTSFGFPGKLTEIGSFAFDGCERLSTLDLPDSLVSVSDAAFRNCTGLKTVSFGRGLESLGNSAFKDCTALVTADLGGCALLSVDMYAFRQCISLKELVLPGTLRSLGMGAVESCSSLTLIRFGGTVSAWRALEKTDGWDAETPAYTVRCNNGETPKGDYGQKV